jgi:hypothetical protein
MGLEEFRLPLREILGLGFSLVFMFWPILLLTPLGGRGPYLLHMVVMWSFLALVRVVVAFTQDVLSWGPIPEPLSTLAFVAVGAVLWTALVVRGGRARALLRRIGKRTGRSADPCDLSAGRFEESVAELFGARGHKAKRTGRTGDHGVDVEVETKDGEGWIVQCKRWRGRVGEAAIRDFYGVMQHEKADKGLVVATGGFTESAREWARGKPIRLCDYELYLKWWQQALSKERGGG